tara:strand:+ start:510 stop:635 length:126 start_codon:yes stop_codon:yes gene_type:complete
MSNIIERLEKIIKCLEEVIKEINKPPPKALTRAEICFEGED